MCQNRNLWRNIGTVSAKKMPCVPEFNDGIYMHCEYEKDALCARIEIYGEK